MAEPARPDSLLPLPPAFFHILLALADEDRHGYGIIQEVLARTNGDVRLSPGTLYRSIQRMLDDERRRYYRITPFGRSVARAEANRLHDLVRLARASGFHTRKA
jgi:DNA-binding PadR family transcriptional regulator